MILLSASNVIRTLKSTAMYNKLSEIAVLECIEQSKILSHAFKFYLERNSSISAPYHNADHMFEMLSMMLDCKSLGFKDLVSLTEDDWETILLATIFHDFNHSNGKYDDEINVTNAKEAFTSFCTLEKYENKMVYELIDATQYPYTVKKPTLQQLVIREIDTLSMIFHSHFFTHSFLGLRTECGVNSLYTCMDCMRVFMSNAMENFKLGYSHHMLRTSGYDLDHKSMWNVINKIINK